LLAHVQKEVASSPFSASGRFAADVDTAASAARRTQLTNARFVASPSRRIGRTASRARKESGLCSATASGPRFAAFTGQATTRQGLAGRSFSKPAIAASAAVISNGVINGDGSTSRAAQTSLQFLGRAKACRWQ